LAGLIAKNSNNWMLIWRSVKDVDKDKNGFLEVDELETCIKD
jgi:hypothetical protein